jgi:2-polyprenyl-6-methoxyphenol hydroxylase-like FAD-dependent oxidoreductase
MPRIVVMGGGICGMAAGLMLARDGHEVTVLERDAARVPESVDAAWESWERRGVVQFRQAHFLAARGRSVLEQELPDVLEALVKAGAKRFDALAMLPPSTEDSAEDRERFVTFTARRPTIERVLAEAAQEEPGLEMRRGSTAAQLVLSMNNATPHASGIRLHSGEVLEADLLVDAMGRGSPLPRWLDAAGIGPLHEESEDSGFIYYTRFFRSADGATPEPTAPLLSPIGSFSIITLPADNGNWSVTACISSGDRPLKRMRDADAWSAVIEACPLHAQWLAGEPTGGIEAMGGIVDRYRRALADGRPLLTGIALLGDAWACTNPSLGRGISLGLMHTQCLRETIGEHLEDPLEFALAWDAVTEEKLTPWYRETVEEDRGRLSEIEAIRNGEPLEPSNASLRAAILVAMLQDLDLLKAYLESRCCLTTLSETFAADGVAERVLALASQQEPQPLPGPSREQLLGLLA